MLDGVVLAVVVDDRTGEHPPHHPHRLLQHALADWGRWPPVAEDVLVERLAAPDAEHETAVQQYRASGRGLGHDGRVDSHGGAGDRGRHRQPAHLRDRTDHRPHERALPLLVVPGMEVVGDPQRIEAGPLGHAGLGDQLRWGVLLGRQRITHSHGDLLFTVAPRNHAPRCRSPRWPG